jgi:guanyl-specific ribonuclease Sa
MTAPTTEEQKKKAATATPAEQPAPQAAKPNAWGKPLALAGLAKAPDPAAVKAQEDAKKEAARQAGLIARNGTTIAKKPLTDFGGDEAKAIKASLDAYDGGTQPTLSHPNGMKWGWTFGNKEQRLPDGNYKEYYVEKAANSKTYHGNRRLVIDAAAQRVYYSATHYGDNGTPAFVLLRGPQAPTGGGSK